MTARDPNARIDAPDPMPPGWSKCVCQSFEFKDYRYFREDGVQFGLRNTMSGFVRWGIRPPGWSEENWGSFEYVPGDEWTRCPDYVAELHPSPLEVMRYIDKRWPQKTSAARAT